MALPQTTQTARVTETSALAPRDAIGRVWRVVVIQEGVSTNRCRYPAEVLDRDHRVFEGVPVAVSWEALDHHDPVGTLRAVACERIDGRVCVTADAVITEPNAQRRLLEAYRSGRPYEFSIDAAVRATETKDGQGRTIQDVTAILEPTELTIVRRGGAGGRVQRLVASAGPVGLAAAAVTGGDENEGSSASARSQGANQDQDEGGGAMPAIAEKSTGTGSKTEDAATAAERRAAEAAPGAPAPSPSAGQVAHAAEQERRAREAYDGAEKARRAAEEAAAAAKAQAETAERRARESEFRGLLAEKLAEVRGLPKEAIARVREAFLIPATTTGADGKPVTTVSVRVADGAAIDAAIKAERDYLARVAESLGAGRVTGLGSDVEITVDQAEKHQAAMDGFFSGEDEPPRAKQGFARRAGKIYTRVKESASASDRIERFRSLHEAAEAIVNGGRRLNAEEVFHACMGGKTSAMRATERFRARESITTSQLANVLVDAIHRRLLKEYMLDSHVALVRRIASQISPIKDFRANQRMRYGGYELLATVAAGATYPTLTSPSDDKQSFVISKKGGVEDLTMEMIANDDVGAVQRIPTKLKQAAVETLFQTIFNDFANNSNIGDGSAIFRSGNKTSSAFTKATMNAARKAMRQQSPPNDTTKKIGEANLPKIWLGPADLEEAALIMFRPTMKVVAPETTTQVENTTAGVPNVHYGTEVHVVDYWTDAADCLVMADPAKMDTLEIGFFNGMEEPELFVQDLVNVGSNFDADKIKFKIRHVWGYLFPDYRPFYGFSRA